MTFNWILVVLIQGLMWFWGAPLYVLQVTHEYPDMSCQWISVRRYDTSEFVDWSVSIPMCERLPASPIMREPRVEVMVETGMRIGWRSYR